MIPVTKPYLPNKDTYKKMVDEIFERNWLTNNGPLVQAFESQLRSYLDTEELLFVSNGTIALQLAIKALGLKGEIITTPFSYVATTSSIVWENCTPVFADIDAATLNIDPSKIEVNIGPNTTAILATHCFGNPCEIEAIGEIADKHNLKVVYDAAHCFGTKYHGKSIFEYGDISTCSLHATKLMHSIEGGLVFANEADLLERMSLMRNFGHYGPEKFNGVGINGKNSEFHAAMGLAILPEVDEIIKDRKRSVELYMDLLASKLKTIELHPTSEWNYSYFPVIFSSEEELLRTMAALEKAEIFPRRYFYPVLNNLPYIDYRKCEIAESVSKRVLCLPLYYGIESEDIKRICDIISMNL